MRRFWLAFLAVCCLACGTTTSVEPPAPPEELPEEAVSPDAGQPSSEEQEELPDAGEPVTGPVGCHPVACSWWGLECGSLPDNCGGVVDCGSCSAGEVCGALVAGMCDPCPLAEDLEGAALPLHREGQPRVSGDWDSTEIGNFYTVFRWVAPADGAYVVDLGGSGPDASFSLHRSHCRGEPLPGAGEGSRVARAVLARGEEVFVNVRGYGWHRSRSYHFQLHIGAWRPDETESCADRWDNDADGYTDCSDADCARTAACASGQACADVELGDAFPIRYTGPRDLDFGPDFFSPSCFKTPHRPELVYRWTAPADGTYLFATHAAGSSMALYPSCRGAELACASLIAPDYDPPNAYPIIRQSLAAGETVLIVVEGTLWDGNVLRTPRKLSIHPPGPEDTEASCSDGLDNDGDGRPDFLDRDCPNYD